MTCASIMTHNPKSVTESETIGRAAAEIIAHRYVNLPVIDRQGRLVGLFGVYDLLALMVPRVAIIGNLLPNLRFMSDNMDDLYAKFEELRNAPIRRAINREPVVVYPETPVIEAIRLFCRNHLTLPVVEKESRKLAGIISYWDAAQAIMGPKK